MIEEIELAAQLIGVAGTAYMIPKVVREVREINKMTKRIEAARKEFEIDQASKKRTRSR